jgi:glycosyltransferase involved in cell wall biosynthesis
MNEIKISIVIPTFNEEGNIEILYQKIAEVFKQITHANFEVIYVNDGSSDGSLEKVKQLSQIDSRVKFISFSRNFGHQNALKAGLDYAQGDAVISMDADLQHPPALIPEMIRLWQEGKEVVYSIRKDGEELSFFKKMTSKLFYKIVNYLSDTKLEEGTADFRLLDKKVVVALKSYNESNLFYRGIIPTLGFRQIGIAYKPQERFSGKTKYSFSKMLRFALTGITSSSAKPLYFSIYLGLFFAAIAFLYGIYAIYISVFTNEAVLGWTSLIASILFIGGLQLIMMGIVGVYLGKLFTQSKNRPNYVIDEIKLE